MALYQIAPSAAIQSFVENNANSIVAHDESAGTVFGALWQGPFESADATRQTSALDAIIPGIAVQGQCVYWIGWGQTRKRVGEVRRP